MTVVTPSIASAEAANSKRHWLAQLDLDFNARSDGKSVLAGVKHIGPLRVQRPFYPEGPKCCHVYLLHPPGGLVVGDELNINTRLKVGAHALLTTPSAGKLYAVPDGGQRQQQTIKMHCQGNTYIEWLPQETIVFDGANGKLLTQFYLHDNAQLFTWDIVCLGRPASRLPFLAGSCLQQIEIWQNEALSFFEKNLFSSKGTFMGAKWGLQGANTSGTLLATVQPGRNIVDDLVAQLHRQWGAHSWGLTQKQDIFIARYLGDSAPVCRKGFELIWSVLRPLWCKKRAVTPRIWFT